ncbi:NAD(P)-binding protein [Peniophora sp. CONT]|nr:NAD(P)-binding protein [Peniophora sp. CONT]
MPAVPSPAKVLVSGVNGYLGVWVARTYLEEGYSVRGTVRSIERAGKHLRDTFASYGDKFELVEVADITASGAFDDAVKGIDVVAHTASPFHYDAEDPAEVIDPAVKGTTSILESILAHGKDVKRVVLTSSIFAIWTMFVTQPTTFTEKDWNEQSIQIVAEKGRAADGASKYGASKTLAEKAAWDLITEHKPTWDLAVLNPPYIWGPPIHDVQSADKLNTSQKLLFDIVTGTMSDDKYDALASGLGAVDVRDIAQAHVRATQLPQAGGTRALIGSFGGYPQEVLDIANSLQPRPWDGLPKGPKPGGTKGKETMANIDTAQFRRVYGFQLHSVEDTIRDSLEDFKKRGWIH